ncbi:phage tail sheath family protein [Archangium lipolyticum]|uniref:phage tail sheath family protein n=1 Tax=Archangium lipolyticum TaxID=2970465 RepID=UPI002149C026|nr:phage tail sheath subtilisin-like domain-containing protein [Archangium lipolyticum]
MPEYLAPAVYVEETSFRSKSIEGVSTSTTGFAGPTLTGPSGGTPELLTSFADFERTYGGLDDFDYKAPHPATNYLAHSVRAYFDEGGSRLYVSRVVPLDAGFASATVGGNTKFTARFKGSVGNGTITVQPIKSPATVRGMNNAPAGTILIGSGSSAVLKGTAAAPFDLSGHTTLTFELGQTKEAVSIHLVTDKVELTAVTPLEKLDADTTLDIVLNGTPQPGIQLTAETPPQEIVDTINSRLQGCYARLDNGALIIGTHLPSLVVKKNSELGIVGTLGVAKVKKLDEVSLQELDRALRGAGIHAIFLDGKVALRTAEMGTTASLAWKGSGPPLGLGAGTATGEPGARTFIKKDTDWVDSGGTSASGFPSEQDAAVGEFVTLRISTRDGAGREALYEDVGLDPQHPRWIGSVLSEKPTRQLEAIQRLYAIQLDPVATGLTLFSQLLDNGEAKNFPLAGGSDGSPPGDKQYADALDVLANIEDISIVAAPGSSAYGESTARAVRNELIKRVEKRRAYRIAVLDTPDASTHGLLSQVSQWRGEIDSKHAALYFPWVVVSNPLARPGNDRIPKEIALPPSGFICGIYARNDVERGVFKAPANEVVRSALRFQIDVNFAQQESLNPQGINCLRFFPGRGYRVWGARTASSDPEWKYVNVRRYFNFLERSIDLGTQWAVFEPNGERLWANIRETIGSFLETQWRSGALLGSDPRQAYFVRCDRSTMTQDDLDNGRLICLVGVAVVKPAEFVIFRIGQKTADARS